jgi:hypothetical protein
MGNFLENTVSGIGDAVGRVGEGLGNAFKGLTGGSGSSGGPTEGTANELKKKYLEMQQAQAGKQGVPMKKGGSVSSASSRGDGIAQRGKTKGTMVMCGGGMARGKK